MRAGDGIVVLGAPVGYHGFVKEKFNVRVEKIRAGVELLPLHPLQLVLRVQLLQ